MPAASAHEIADALIRAFRESGASAFLESSTRKQPRKLLVRENGRVLSVWIYIWTLTPGGRPNLPNEYRIQMTGVTAPLDQNLKGLTLLMGYDQDTGAFAGFDLTQHSSFTVGSPSVQVDKECLFQALQEGIAFKRKSNDEVAIGIRSDHILHYSLSSIDLHMFGKETDMPEVLTQASAGTDIEGTTTQSFSPERKRIVANVAKWTRSAGFRKQVLTAYDNRCAVTRLQLGLVEAAHILPVHDQGSTDLVTNGIALSPTYHRAFDHGLVYLDENFVMRLNENERSRLESHGLTGGLRRFEESLGVQIHLPQDANQRPDPFMVRQANQLRGISI